MKFTPSQWRVQYMTAVAHEKADGFQEMGTLRCEGCGEEFSISHDPAFADKWVAEKQASWLEKALAEEHEREKKHAHRIELPDCSARPGTLYFRN